MDVECGYLPFWQLFEETARRRYGYDIEILPDETPINKINFTMTVIARDNHPHEATRTVVDIHTKEYINHGSNTTDESNIRMSKVFKNGHYAFTSTKGIDFGFGSDIGAKVISLAVGGDSTLINAFFNRTGNKVAPNDDFTFTYHQEEKISVPPGHSITAKITTYSTRYDQDYTLKFSVPRDLYVPVVYRTSCQQCFSCVRVSAKTGWCKQSRRVLVRDIICRLSEYNGNDVNNTVSFTQRGTLSWVGGGSCVNKVQNEMPTSKADGVQIVHSFHSLSPKPKAAYAMRYGPNAKKAGEKMTFEADKSLKPGGILQALSVDKITHRITKGLQGVRNCRSVERVTQALKSVTGKQTEVEKRQETMKETKGGQASSPGSGGQANEKIVRMNSGEIIEIRKSSGRNMEKINSGELQRKVKEIKRTLKTENN